MDLHTGYAQVHSAVVEQQQLLAYVPLVKRIVRQLGAQAGAAMDREDMEQTGLLGLLCATRCARCAGASGTNPATPKPCRASV
jgi:RNA polymerase sigma factor for flagellar operon FliA